ncbi:type 4a pilus biogenesis protein PilO [Paenibacillus sp. P36]|uniref:type 4a pilus biogenesis protein PilO n=1 Tax=Paenibacillus sp. P36 TaxID=3342538 RepID=UPI0038B35B13
MSNKNNAKSLFLFLSVLLFLGLFAFYYFIQLPSTNKIKAQENEMALVEKQIQILTKKLSEKKEDVGPSLKDIQAALPLWDNTEQLTLDLNQIKTSSKVTFNSISYAVSDKSTQTQQTDANSKNPYPNVREVRVTTSVSGKFNEITDAITQLQALPRLIRVDTINFGNLPKDTSRKLTVNLTFTAYFDPSYKSRVDKVELPY